MNEHDYIKQLIADRWWGEVDRRVHPLQDEARRLLRTGLFDDACVLEAQVARLNQDLISERWVAVDRLRWLELDTALRLEGKNYPDVYEGATRKLKFHESQEF